MWKQRARSIYLPEYFSVNLRDDCNWNTPIPIISTLFMSQLYLAEHRASTNWGDGKSNQIKCWFLVRGENRSTRGKTSRSRVENQQTQPTYDVRSALTTAQTLLPFREIFAYILNKPDTNRFLLVNGLKHQFPV